MHEKLLILNFQRHVLSLPIFTDALLIYKRILLIFKIKKAIKHFYMSVKGHLSFLFVSW